MTHDLFNPEEEFKFIEKTLSQLAKAFKILAVITIGLILTLILTTL